MKYVYLLCCLLLAVRGWGQSSAVLRGIVQTETGTPLPGATVFLKGTYLGGSTNEEGRFEVKVPAERFPVLLVVSFLGFETQTIALSQPEAQLEVTLRPSAVLSQVVVAASRVAETVGTAPVTVDKLNEHQVQQLTTPDLVAGLARLPGVDVSNSSMLTTAFSTRGFNSSRSERVIQLNDYMDTQLPSLNSNFGNQLGAPILDIASVELVHGPASALYGANAFNGVLLTNSRDPFLDPGLSVRLRGGNRNLLDGQLRYAVKLGERVAFKLSGGATVADDFIADNQDATSKLIEPANNPAGSNLGYDAVNRYGDLGFAFNGVKYGALNGKTVFLPGYSERDLIANDYKTRHYKVAPSLAVLLTSSIKATLDYRYNNGVTSYQNASRYRFVNSGLHQARVQVEGSNWFVRAFSTRDYSGGRDPGTDGTYNLGFLGAYLQTQAVPDAPTNPQTGRPLTYAERYFGTYAQAYNQAYQASGGSADAAAQAAHDVAAAHAPLLQPGTPAFDAARNQIIHNSTQGQGARTTLRSFLNDASAQYRFNMQAVDLVVGGAYRQYLLGSDGSLFADTPTSDRIRNYEFGGYAQATKVLARERLKLSAAARVDRFQNFGTAVSPRASVVYSAGVDKQQNFRLSYSRAFRQPTETDQYIRFDVGRAILLGNVGSGFNGYTLGPGGALAPYHSDALKLEQVNSLEAGYRAQLSKALYVDVNYYYSFYNNFIASQNFVGNLDGSQPTAAQLGAAAVYNFQNPTLPTRVIQISTNVDQRVQSQGAGLSLGYVVGPALTLSGNYSFSDLLTTDFRAGTLSFYNTPRHKFNVGFDGQALERKLSYNVNYRWAASFLYESSFAIGTVPVAQTLDAQLGYLIRPARTTMQAGVTNLLDQINYSVYGSPQFGRLGYFGVLFEIK